MTAYDYLLHGNRYFYRVAYDDLLGATRLYRQTVELDPQFALAYSRLAATDDVLTGLGLLGGFARWFPCVWRPFFELRQIIIYFIPLSLGTYEDM
jgi:hypothetical protein